MVIQSIHFTFAPEDADRAEALFLELREASRAEEGVAGFEVARSREKPNVFALWEQYRDEEALALHVAAPHYVRLVINAIRPLAQQRAGETVYPI